MAPKTTLLVSLLALSFLSLSGARSWKNPSKLNLETPVRHDDGNIIHLNATSYFLHIRKTGGGTFCKIVEDDGVSPLRACYKPLHVLWNTHPPRNLSVRLPLDSSRVDDYGNVVGDCIASAEAWPSFLVNGALDIEEGIDIYTFVREPTTLYFSDYSHRKAHHVANLKFGEYVKYQYEKIENNEDQLICSQEMEGLARMKFIGVTDYYSQSLCALKSVLNNRPMCTCPNSTNFEPENKVNPKYYVTHGSKSGATQYSAETLVQLRQIPNWQCLTQMYVTGYNFLKATLEKYDLGCLLLYPTDHT